MHGLRIMESLAPQCSRWAVAIHEDWFSKIDQDWRLRAALTYVTPEYFEKHPEDYAHFTEAQGLAWKIWRKFKKALA